MKTTVSSKGQIVLPAAALLARLRASGKAMPVKNSLIAATALRHDLSVVTRNRSDFVKAGVRVVDPFAG